MFYFEQVLQTALSGIDINVTGPIVQLAGVILLLSLMFSVYEAYSNGGDVRSLGVAAVKYLALGLVFANYPQVFRSVNAMFNGAADYIYKLNGIGDLIQNWMNALSNYVNNAGISSFWDLITGGFGGLLEVLLLAVGMIILPISYTLFTLAYAAYGSVLYVTGPLVLALLPSRSFGHVGRTYLVNLMIFQSWGLLYAILQVLMTAINMNTMNNVLNAGSVLNAFVGASQMLLLGMASILLSIGVLLIPFIASRIVRGEVGSTMFAVVSAATTMATLGAKGALALSGSSSSDVEGGNTPRKPDDNDHPPDKPPDDRGKKPPGKPPDDDKSDKRPPEDPPTKKKDD
jgi:hypothetical protein